jgi:hypothetical protein
MEMLEEEMSKAVLEVIDVKLSPILEKFEKTDSDIKELNDWRADVRAWLDDWRADIDRKFADMEKKFVVTARLIESVMDAVEKTSSAKKCEADIKGIQLLKGELKDQ